MRARRTHGIVAAIALIVAACGPSAPSAAVSPLPSIGPAATTAPTIAGTFPVVIEPGVQAHWSADAAAAAMVKQIAANERLEGRALAAPKILSVEAWLGEDVPPNIGAGAMFGHDIVWVVRAEGTFVAFSCPVAPCPGDTSGFAMFDDTGLLIGDGFPLPSPDPRPDCAGVAPADCIVAVAVSKRYGFKPTDEIVDVRVRPTRFKIACYSVVPKFDLTYTFRNPIAIVTVTVGQLPDGRWDACTY